LSADTLAKSPTDVSSADAWAQSSEDFRFDVRTLLVIFSIMLATILEIVDTSIVNVALPEMMGNLGATLDEISWVVTGYIISNVIIIPMTGWLSTRFGRKRYFTTSILIFTTASFLCGISQTLTQLVAFRILQGLGGGALISTSQAILTETFPPKQQGIGQAIFGVGAMVGPSLGPTLGGWITDNYSWPWIFFINVPLGLFAAFMCATQIRDPEYLRARRRAGVDWPGMLFLVVGIGALQTVLERGHRLDWFSSTEVRVLAASAAFSIVAFIVRELNCDHPVVDLRILKHRCLAVGCAYGAVLGVGLYGSIFLFPVFSQNLLRWSAWQSGLAILPSSLGSAAIMLFVGHVVWYAGPRRVVICGVLIFICSMFFMADWTLQSGWYDVIWPQVLRGVALGCIFVPMSTSTLRALPPADVAQGAGLYNLFRQLGGSFGIAVLVTILDQRATIHRTNLVSKMGLLDPMAANTLSGMTTAFAQRGLDPVTAHQTALGALDRLVNAQATALAFADAYWGLMLLFVIALPFAVLIARESPGRSADKAQASAKAQAAQTAAA